MDLLKRARDDMYGDAAGVLWLCTVDAAMASCASCIARRGVFSRRWPSLFQECRMTKDYCSIV